MMIRAVTHMIQMPYMAGVSVNHCYNRNEQRRGIKVGVQRWLTALKIKFNEQIDPLTLPPWDEGAIYIELSILTPHQKGQIPDTHNFIKLPLDIIQDVLGVDDSVFTVVAIPARRCEPDEEPAIRLEIKWAYEVKGASPGLPFGDASPLHYAPLHMMGGSDMARRMGLINTADGTLKVCPGFGTPFCTGCADFPNECPVAYNPAQYADIPCKDCDELEDCPCQGKDRGCEDRVRRIEVWWEARQKSVGFECENWHEEFPF